MGFFADLKEDLSQAVSELMPQEQLIEDEEVKSEEVKSEAEEKGTDNKNMLDFESEISLEEMLKNIDEFCLPEDETSLGEEAVAQPAENVVADDTDAVMPDEAVGWGMDAMTDQAAEQWIVEELPEDADEEIEKAEAEDLVAKAVAAKVEAAEKEFAAEAKEIVAAVLEETESQAEIAAAWGQIESETEMMAAAEEISEETADVETEVPAAETVAAEVAAEMEATGAEAAGAEVTEEEATGTESKSLPAFVRHL